tara:strand:+ start:470 stop:823 length:354 start_codon:yes stop_codon:yes gene_type:complete
MNKLSCFFVIALLTSCGTKPSTQADETSCIGEGDVPKNSKQSPNPEMCCGGLLLRSLSYIEKTQNNTSYCVYNRGGIYNGICVNCGDDVCDDMFEDKCICPEDCGSVSQENYVDELK